VFKLGNFLKEERSYGLTTLQPIVKPLIGFSTAKNQPQNKVNAKEGSDDTALQRFHLDESPLDHSDSP